MKKTIVCIVVLALALSSCKKRFEDLNKNPNNPTDVPSEMMLPTIMLSAAHFTQLNAGLQICDQWVQFTKSTTYMDEDRYKARADRMDAIWNGYYASGFEDCLQAIKRADKDNRPNNKAIALIMKAYIGYNLTTLFGSVPYSKAGQGADGVIAVPYDTQVDVFNSCIADIDQAIGLLDPNSPLIGTELASNDLIYGGDMDKWKKFANGLKIRIYLTMTAGGTNKVSDINTIIASGDVFSSSADDAALRYLTSPSTNSNPVYLWVNPGSDRHDDYRMSESLVTYMMGSSVDSTAPADLRLTLYAELNDSGKYAGGQNGVTGGQSENSMLGYSKFFGPTSAFNFMTYTELLFIQAELDTTIQANYEAAVRASFLQNGLTLADANTMLADPKFAWNAAKGGELIHSQKWVSLFGQGVEAFNSWRRSGYPRLTPASNGATVTGYVPRRIAYNSDEKSLNSSNVNTGIGALTPADDRISSKVWFDRSHNDSYGNK